MNNNSYGEFGNEEITINPNQSNTVGSSNNSEGINTAGTIGGFGCVNSNNGQDSSFKVVGQNLPEKTGVWTKIKNALFYEVKVELTPYQQKVEDEVNEFLHQEVTWKSFTGFLFKEIPITFKGKRIF